ncbi:hypothetical protein IFM89_038581 [Coptis chinensis]|uniref:Pentatricopeptide repeat-containing protein n=1 Tax=Coptis chinensis TaxID=261450 RepID=A0A835HJJ0_9MAGN|nr:hypothetical protein IFM89_038581 [Coptis chinensis]
MPQRNVFSWTVMIVGSTENGLFLDGFRYFCKMQSFGIQPDKFAYSALVQACIGLSSVELGKMVHAQIVKGGLTAQVVVTTSLLNMYAKCGEVEDSVRVFNNMSEHNQVSWNAMISGFASNVLHLEAYDQYIKMKNEGCTPNVTTFASILKSVANLGDIDKGRKVHNYVNELGLESNIQVGTALINMYSKCGYLDDARTVFDRNYADCKLNLPWNAMISGYSQENRSEEALELFSSMCMNNVKFDFFTYGSVFSALGELKCLHFTKEVHAVVVKSGYDLQVSSVNNVIAHSYFKCGSLEDAMKVFERMEERDVISWTTMITAYATSSMGEKALGLFSQMRKEGITPNQFTFGSVLAVCGSLCLLDYGRQIHGLLYRAGLKKFKCIESALIDMYAKCASIIEAEKAFKEVVGPDVVSWTAILSGYALHGFTSKALQVFRNMEESGTKPNAVTLLCILFACSHGGTVEDGLHHFQSMEARYGLVPEMVHYACVVDLLGRVGRLNDAMEFINNMPIEPTDMIWQTLLAACRVHGNIELGEIAAKKILSVSPQYSATYVLLSNTYIEKGSVKDGLSLRNVMRDRGVKKEPGFSWISVRGAAHKFFSGDQRHPQREEINAKLAELREKMKAMGPRNLNKTSLSSQQNKKVVGKGKKKVNDCGIVDEDEREEEEEEEEAKSDEFSSDHMIMMRELEIAMKMELKNRMVTANWPVLL